MFLNFYGLREQPFGVTPDPRFLYLGAAHREAFASLCYGIETGRGFIALIAQPGMGKTTLLFRLMEQIRTSMCSVFLFQKQSSEREFLRDLMTDLGLESSNHYDLGHLQRLLNDRLLQEFHQGRRFVLVLDEAQNLDSAILETVRMLSNFEVPQAKLMQIVLAGQPQLAAKLESRELLQLRQRISIFCRLDPFEPPEVECYIAHRLRSAGCEGTGLFTRKALQMIAEFSGGIPRVINNICFQALSLGYAKNEKAIGPRIIEEVASDLSLAAKDSRISAGGYQSSEAVGPGPGISSESSSIEGEESGVGSVRLQDHDDGSVVRQSTVKQSPRTRWLVGALALAAILWSINKLLSFSPSGGRSLSTIVASLLQEGPFSKRGSAKSAILPSEVQRHSAPQAAGSPSLQPTTRDPDISASNHQLSGTSLPSTPPTGLDIGIKEREGLKPSPAGRTSGGEDSSATIRNSPDLPTSAGRIVDKLPDRHVLKTGRLNIASNVEGAWILLNGTTKKGWVTPHMFTLVEGNYRISVTKIGYAPVEKFANVRSGQTSDLFARLAAEDTRGAVIVETEPSGLPVLIDGRSYGRSRILVPLLPGSHELEVLPPPGQAKYTGRFELKSRGLLQRTIRWSDGPQRKLTSRAEP